MPGEVLECESCKTQTRWGYPTHAISFAQSKRPNASVEEIINDFFEFNKGILREKPEKCPKCGKKEFSVLHTYD